MKCYESEDEFFDDFKKSVRYNFFKITLSYEKKRKEQKAWSLIQTITETDDESIGKIFDDFIKLVDCHYHDSHGGWFGLAFREANTHKIKNSNSAEKLKTWFYNLIKRKRNYEQDYQMFDECLSEHNKIKGAKTGLPSLLLYLKSSIEFNVWLPVNQRALHILDPDDFQEGIEKPFSYYYKIFNDKIKTIREHGFPPQDIDWILTFVERKVKREGKFLCVDEKELNKKVIQLRN